MASLQGHREIEGAMQLEIDDWPWPQRKRERDSAKGWQAGAVGQAGGRRGG